MSERVFDSEKMRQLGCRGAAVTNSKFDGRELTAAARRAYRASFEALVDPDRLLPEPERTLLADRARNAHYRMLSVLAVAARQRKRAQAGTV